MTRSVQEVQLLSSVEQRERLFLTQMLKFILLTMFSATALFAVIALTGQENNLIFPLLIVCAAILGLFWLVQREYLFFPSLVLPLMLLSLFTFLLATEGVINTAMLGYFVVIILAGVLLGQWSVPVFTLLSIGATLSVFYAQINGLTPASNLVPSPTISDIVSFSVDIIVGAALFYVPLHQLRRSLDQTRLNEQALANSNEQLQTIRASLEEQVLERTHKLELAATLAERLSAILDRDQLLHQFVHQVQDSVGFDRVAIYLLDQQRQTLVLATKADSSAEVLAAAPYQVTVDMPHSFIAQALRTGQIVQINNGSPSSIIAAMAVPIFLDGQSIGILLVQKVGQSQLDEDDATLLRSLVNQVAVGIRNARLFAEVSVALNQAQAAQDQYISQVWIQNRESARKKEGNFRRAGVYGLPDLALEAGKQRALMEDQPYIVPYDDNENSGNSLVAPIKLGRTTIGTFQLYDVESSAEQRWNQQDLDLVTAVLAQVAQSAENFRLLETTRKRANEEQAIRELSNKLRNASSLQYLVTIAAEELGERFGAVSTKIELGIEAKDNKKG